jgi:hypothetical protein
MLKNPKMLVRFCADFVMPAPERNAIYVPNCDLHHALYAED